MAAPPVKRGFVRRWCTCLAKWLAVIVLASFTLMWFCAGPFVDGMYANVLPEATREMPVTAAAIEATSSVTLTQGGRGEGLSCSIPVYLGPIFHFEDVSTSFRQACAYHDFCYRHGAATYGYTQQDCDQLLQQHAFRLCDYVYERSSVPFCQREARKVLAGVRVGGAESFKPRSPRVGEPSEAPRLSTFFEFDSYPTTREEFSVARIAPLPNARRSPEYLERAIYYFSVRPSGLTVSVVAVRPDRSTVRVDRFVVPGAPPWIVSAPVVERDRFRWWRRTTLSDTRGALRVLDPRTASAADWQEVFVGGSERDVQPEPDAGMIYRDPRSTVPSSGASGESYVAFAPHRCGEGDHDPSATHFKSGVEATCQPIDMDAVPSVNGNRARYRSFVTPPLFHLEDDGLALYFTREGEDVLHLLRISDPALGKGSTSLTPQRFNLATWSDAFDPMAIVPGKKPSLIAFIRDREHPAGAAQLVSISATDERSLFDCASAKVDALDGTWLDLPPVFLETDRKRAILKKAEVDGAGVLRLREYETSHEKCSLVAESPPILIAPTEMACNEKDSSLVSRLLGQSIVTDLNGDELLDLIVANPECPAQTVVRLNVFGHSGQNPQ